MGRSVSPLMSLLLALGVSMFSGCQETKTSQLDSLQEAAGPAAGLPPFPEEAPAAGSPVQRQGSVNLNLTLQGSEFLQSNSAAQGDDLLLQPAGSAGIGWAIYRFSSLAPEIIVSTLSVAMEELAAGEQYFLALADYDAARWQIISVEAQQGSQNFDIATEFSAARHVSAAGNLHLAVISELAVTLDSVTMLGSGPLPTPQGLVASDGEFPERVDVSWQSVAGADGYELFYKQQDEPEEFFAFLAALEGSESTLFSHGEVNPPGKPCLYDTVYDYRVRAVDAEETSAFSDSDSGFRITAGPSEFYASRGIYPDLISLNGLGPDEPHTYQIFRDGVLLAVLPDIVFDFEYLDTEVSDFLPHEYHVIVIGPDGPSAPSAVQVGYRGDWQSADRFLQPFFEPFHCDLQESTGNPAEAAVCAYVANWVEDQGAVVYYQEDGAGIDLSVVTTMVPDCRMSLCNHLGRPWIALYNADETAGDTGIYIARASTAVPGDADWELTHLGQEVLGQQLVLRVVDGRLMLLALCRDAFGDPQLRIAQALLEDPQSELDWSIETVPQNGVGPASLPYYDMAQIAGHLVLAAADGDGLYYFRSLPPDPDFPGDWSGHEIFSFPDNDTRFVSMCELNGRPCILAAGCQLEGSGFAIFSSPWVDEPLFGGDWNLTGIDDFNDESVQSGGIGIFDGKPLLCWTNNKNSSISIASPVNDQPGFFNGFWHLLEPAPDLGFIACMDESAMAIIGGQPVLLSVVAKEEGVSDKAIVLSRLPAPPLP